MISTFRIVPYAAVSVSLAAWVVLLALHQRANFYAAAVYLSKSNACMLILWNFGIFTSICCGKVLQKVLFGPLRLIEIEHLNERVWYTVTESLLALTIFRDEFDTSFVVLFVSLLFVKIFHWLAGDRVEAMEQTAEIPRKFHLRMIATLSLLWIVDLLLVVFGCESILLEGPSVMILFVSEYLILLATVWSTSAKYMLHSIDLASDVPWESKSVLLYYVDLATDFCKLVTYVAFFSFIMTFYGLPLNILRDVYLTLRSFIKKCKDLHRYKMATQNMDDRYPNASPAEMEAMTDKTCIICREDMSSTPRDRPTEPTPTQPRQSWLARFKPQRKPPNETPKRLPCGHVFHFHCLKSWLERQQSCPTWRVFFHWWKKLTYADSRRPILTTPATAAPDVQPALPRPQAQPQPHMPIQTPAAAGNTHPPANADAGRAPPDPIQTAAQNIQRTLPNFLRAPNATPELRPRRVPNPLRTHPAQLPSAFTPTPTAENPLWRFLNSQQPMSELQANPLYKVPVIALPELGVPDSLKIGGPSITSNAGPSSSTTPTPMRSRAELREEDMPRLIPLTNADPTMSLRDRIALLEETQRQLAESIHAMKQSLPATETDVT